MLPAAGVPGGQGWRQAGELGMALLLSAVIGVEREVRGKDAGLRTHALVSVGSALFMLVSKYGAAYINEYIHEPTGGDYTAKDFRTWHATVWPPWAWPCSGEPAPSLPASGRPPA